jgi:hypothetical protein
MIMIRGSYQNHIYNSSGSDFADKFENGGLHQHVDIPRLEKGKDYDVRTACETYTDFLHQPFRYARWCLLERILVVPGGRWDELCRRKISRQLVIPLLSKKPSIDV